MPDHDLPDHDPPDHDLPDHNLPASSLPSAVTLIEQALTNLHRVQLDWQHAPLPSTQVQAAQQYQEIALLEGVRADWHVFDRQRQRWADQCFAGQNSAGRNNAGQRFKGQSLTTSQKADLERFSSLVNAYRQALEASLNFARARQQQVKTATGFEGFDDSTRHDALSGFYDQPIAHLPLLAELIDDEFDDAQVLLEDLTLALDRPHVLDDSTLDRIEHQYGLVLEETVRGFAWQLERWNRIKCSKSQRAEVSRLERQLQVIADRAEDVLKLTQRLRHGVIERITERSDLELGLDVLVGRVKRTG
jgi:hypothetical protein